MAVNKYGQYSGWHLRVWYMAVAAVDVAAGIVTILSLGFYVPRWAISFLVWHMERTRNDQFAHWR